MHTTLSLVPMFAFRLLRRSMYKPSQLCVMIFSREQLLSPDDAVLKEVQPLAESKKGKAKAQLHISSHALLQGWQRCSAWAGAHCQF